MKLFKKLSLFVALVITTVAIAPAMPDAHAANALVFANSDIIAYIDINLSYSSESTFTGSVDVVDPSDPLLVGEVLTVPINAPFEDNFDIVLVDANGTTFFFYNFNSEISTSGGTFEIVNDNDNIMAINFSAPGFTSETFYPDVVQ